MYCGTSNIVLPVRNKTFYPEAFRDKSRLHYYSSLFNSLEVNQTFYKVPQERTIARWSTEVLPGFRFSVKLWKGITHNKNLVFAKADVKKFMQIMNAFADTKGCMLMQFPAGLDSKYFKRVARLLDAVSSYNNGWKLAVEFRHRNWYTKPVWELLKMHGACLVEHDMPKSRPPKRIPSAPFRFIRFHGILGDYRGTYKDELLNQYAAGIQKDECKGKEIYAYFNNTLGAAVHNALTLQQYSCR